MEEKYMKIHPRSLGKAIVSFYLLCLSPLLVVGFLGILFNSKLANTRPIAETLFGLIIGILFISIFSYGFGWAIAKLYNRFVSKI